jgi:AraC-like DNA-binding protein
MLAVAMLSVSSTYWYHMQPALFGLLDWPVAVLGPCFYFYVRRMVGLGTGRWPWLHFVPLGVLAGLLLSAHGDLRERAWRFDSILMAYELVATAYALVAAVRLHTYRRRLEQSFSSLRGRDLLWLSWLCVVVVLILTICVLTSLAGGIWIWLLMVLRLAVVYVVGWYGLRQGAIALPSEMVEPAASAVAAQAEAETAAPVTPDAPEADAATPATPATPASTTAEVAETEKYARSGMTAAAEALIGQRLAQRMQTQRDHLESDLTLAELAGRIGTSPQLLSQYLNHRLGLSFFDYVNGLRVAEVQALLADPARAKTPVLDLAFEAGFNSKSTFNAAFRRVCGMTPSEWRRRPPAPAEGASTPANP